MYDMDELEIQKKILLDITSRELKEEKDKWHRRYNDALIEIAKLSKENEDYKMAIHRLIKERDMAIEDMSLSESCCTCGWKDVPYGCCVNGMGCHWIWRGVKR